ncbi:carbohydrate ABC transporter permease [Streptomyces roseochromogenus]|uniref:Sugar ABC transporter permease n=1 Tax=Streptomyces roseochromogenus subsp. oscitans DS 12.976 TaxID=1352936 RepID=V6JPT4_STRRC|nr:sugar ABC transporter permease [Streptomyces roseochromogenus]EST18859.1 sugar ABC transporter permease [Streptomyces roseochromogenus subsp. oscitans DS 12.976]
MADTTITPDTTAPDRGNAYGQSSAPLSPRRRTRARATAGSGRMAALLVSPTLLVLTIVVFYPTLMALRESLYGPKGLDPKTGFIRTTEPFVGLRNYADVFGAAGDRFWNAFGNTTFFTVVTVALETVIGVAMALIMHRAFRGRALVRAGILVPWAVPTAISALLWRWIFNSDGVANAILGHQILWTTEGFHAKVAVIVAEVWKTAPFIGLLVLAGLQVIPKEVYEAARIDGASALRQFWHITLPLVKPALLVAVLFRCLDALRMFDLPYILIGAQKNSVETLSMLAQNEASNVRFGPASAYAVLLFLYVLLMALAFVRLLGTDLVSDRDGRKASRSRHRRNPAARRAKEGRAA